MRKKNVNFKPFPKALSKARKRIETLFSQLCDQFMIRGNYAKSFDGFSTSILSKITALTPPNGLINKTGITLTT